MIVEKGIRVHAWGGDNHPAGILTTHPRNKSTIGHIFYNALRETTTKQFISRDVVLIPEEAFLSGRLKDVTNTQENFFLKNPEIAEVYALLFKLYLLPLLLNNYAYVLDKKFSQCDLVNQAIDKSLNAQIDLLLSLTNKHSLAHEIISYITYDIPIPDHIFIQLLDTNTREPLKEALDISVKELEQINNKYKQEVAELNPADIEDATAVLFRIEPFHSPISVQQAQAALADRRINKDWRPILNPENEMDYVAKVLPSNSKGLLKPPQNTDSTIDVD